jgi:hypothetical protein
VIRLLPVLFLGACSSPASPEVPTSPEIGTGPPPARTYATAAEAMAPILALQPRVLAIGEYHSSTAGPAVPSAISRFTADVLPVLAPTTTDLVVETWVLEGTCGEAEATVAEKVPEETHRPPATEDEVTRLIRRATELGVRPHALSLSCADYASLVDGAGGIRYDALLEMLTAKMKDLAEQSLAVPDSRLVIYGGAVHNDLRPKPGTEPYSFGPTIEGRIGLAYVELDLLVPEVVAAKEELREEAWFHLVADATGPDRVVLEQSGASSFILLLPTTPAGSSGSE